MVPDARQIPNYVLAASRQFLCVGLVTGALWGSVVWMGCGNVADLGPTPTPGLTADLDGDGYLASEDCNDIDPLSHPDALERCDGQDNDCNGVVDEGLDIDIDQDGFSGCASMPAETDCDDGTTADNPAAQEICDGKDNNCDGVVDEGFDLDADGSSTCGTPPDCNDSSATVSPLQPETCNAQDDNCDGTLDEGLPVEAYEPNESADAATNLGVLADLAISTQGSVSSLTDQDWYAVTLSGALEKYSMLAIRLEGVPVDSAYTVSAYPVGSDAALGSAQVESGAPVELELDLESLGDYSTTLLVQVSWSSGAYGCPPYTLSLQLGTTDSAQ